MAGRDVEAIGRAADVPVIISGEMTRESILIKPMIRKEAVLDENVRTVESFIALLKFKGIGLKVFKSRTKHSERIDRILIYF